jgi:hypothetical protein
MGGVGSGGIRKGAGRKHKSPSKTNLELRKAIMSRKKSLPLEYLINIMRSSKQTPERRFAAAVAAAPYLHPKLQSIQHNVNPLDLRLLTDEQLDLVRRLTRSLAENPPGSGGSGVATTGGPAPAPDK